MGRPLRAVFPFLLCFHAVTTSAAAASVPQDLPSLLAVPEDARGPAHHYNLGTLYLQEGRVGLAVAHLEKARIDHPWNGDILHNLQLARATLAKKLSTDALDPASNEIERLADGFPLVMLSGVLSIAALGLSLGWGWVFARRRSWKASLSSPIGVAAIATLSIALLFQAVLAWGTAQGGIVLEPTAIRSGPGPQFVELARAEPGVKLRALGPSASSGDSSANREKLWRQVRFSADGGIGWIPASSLLLL